VQRDKLSYTSVMKEKLINIRFILKYGVMKCYLLEKKMQSMLLSCSKQRYVAQQIQRATLGT
jgi:hypothetical protein